MPDTTGTFTNNALLPSLSIVGLSTVGTFENDAFLPSFDITDLYGTVGTFDKEAFISLLEMVPGGRLGLTAILPSIEITTIARTSGSFVNNALLSALSLSGLEGTIGTFANTAFIITLDISGYSDTTGTFINNTLLAVLDIHDLTTYKCIVINTDNWTISEYENFDFNSIAQLKDGRVLLANSSGVYLLGGDTDNGATISAQVRTFLDDLKVANLKVTTDCYMGVESDGSLNIKPNTDGDIGTASILITSSDAPKTRKVEFGRGLKSRYWGIDITNVSGSNFYINTIELLIEILQRKK